MEAILDSVRKLDAYPKTLDDFRVRTVEGAVVSLFSVVFMIFLFFSELSYYTTTQTVDVLSVDQGLKEKLTINFNVTFPSTSCALISMSAMDPSGDHELTTDHEVFKHRLDAAGVTVGEAMRNNMGGTIKTKDQLHELKEGEKGETKCLSCYGAGDEGQCCNTCEEVKQVYAKKGWKMPVLNMRNHITQCANEGYEASQEQKGEGCNLHGHFKVNKVSGNFHFGPSKSFQHAHLYTFDLMSFTTEGFNISHKINQISFGDEFPGLESPLDGTQRMMPKDEGSGMFQYYVQVVPTGYEHLAGEVVSSNQYAVTEHMRKISVQSHRWLPGVFFFYEISSIKVNIKEQRRGLVQFLTSACAIIGGVFTVMGLVDSMVHSLLKRQAGGLG
jgi:hypothetical protein